MASDLSARTGAETPAISFAVDSLAQDPDGRVEITGRWFGIRGRRFVRPTLTATLESGGERRALAELEHKPWASEDGEPWIAAFALGVELAEAAELELNVAPDITIPLGPAATTKAARQRGGSRSSRQPSSAGAGARSPRVRSSPPARPAMADRSQEIERLRGRLADREAAHDRERARREQAERHLEDERTEALRLRSEVGRLGAELDLAAAVHDELRAASAELEQTRGQALAVGRELELARQEAAQTRRQLETAREQGRATGQALEATRSEALAHEHRLQETRQQLEALQHERDEYKFALEQERAETKRLHRELEDAEDAVRRLAGTRSGNVSRARPVAAGGEGEEGDGIPEAAGESHFPSRTHAGERRLEPMSPRLRALNKLEGSSPPWADRPLNPSLRPADNWILRGLAVVLVVVVLVVIVVLINSTVG
ncbi:MAG TPA: hypothetical protein VF781_05880 [Solirubrobacteraceae bacterium]